MSSAANRKLLFVVNSCSAGGAEMHLLKLTKGLLETGRLDIELAYFKLAPRDARSLVPDFRALDVPVHDLELLPGGNLHAFRRLAALIRRVSPDIIHTHLLRADLFGLPIARALRVPRRIASVHALEPQLRGGPTRQLMRLGYTQANRVIAISNAVRELLERGVGVPSNKVKVVPYGIERTEPDERENARVRAQFGVAQDAPFLGTVGRLNTVKGHKYLIEAMPQIVQAYPSVRLLLVGHDDGERGRLEALASGLGLDGNVVFAGPRMDVARINGAIDVFVLPSLSEGLGQVLLEAMHAGRPTVASNVGAIPEVVVDGETGILVPPQNPEELAEAIMTLIGDPGLRVRMGQAGYRRALASYSLETMIERTLAVYDEALS